MLDFCDMSRRQRENVTTNSVQINKIRTRILFVRECEM